FASDSLPRLRGRVSLMRGGETPSPASGGGLGWGLGSTGANMPIRTGRQFLAALKDDRQIFMDGERIRDIAGDPRTAGAAQTLAELYDMQHDPVLAGEMSFASPS